MLEARSVSVRLGMRALLDGVSLAVGAGETLVVLGENGAGKSTLLRVLAGDRLPPRATTTGTALLNGRPVRDWTIAERAALRAVLPQRPEIAFAFTAREVVAMGRQAARGAGRAPDDGAIAGAALALSDAGHLADRVVSTLSGGEQARVHLAATFAQLWDLEHPRARFLLLDEPTAAIDLAHQHALLAGAKAFAQPRGIGIVAILHDLNLAATYADRVLVLHRGAVLAQGEARDVLAPDTIATGFDVDAAVLAHPLRQGMLIATAARDVAAQEAAR